jgi:two-component system response regulator AtoC
MEVSPEAMQCLIEYSYPGNIRELRNILERASVLAPDQVITPEDLPADLLEENGYRMADESFIMSEAVAKTEKHVLLKALAHTMGKKGEAAELLGISRKNLWEKMRHYGIS